MKSLIVPKSVRHDAEHSAELLDAKAAGALLSVSARHLFRLVDSGDAPAPRRLGRAVRWSRRELLAWLDAGCPSPRKTGWKFNASAEGGRK